MPTGSEIPGGAAPSLPGQSFPQTTKPRQIPGGSAMGETPGPAMGFDPTSNGAANLPAPATLGAEPVTNDTMSMAPTVTNDTMQSVNPRVSAIAAEILQHNPGLSPEEARGIAVRAFRDYLMREPGWEHNPLEVMAARDLDLDPEPVQGRGVPLPPRGPARPQERQEDTVGGQEWYQHGEAPSELANAVVPAEHSLWDRMSGGHEVPRPGGRT